MIIFLFFISTPFFETDLVLKIRYLLRNTTRSFSEHGNENIHPSCASECLLMVWVLVCEFILCSRFKHQIKARGLNILPPKSLPLRVSVLMWRTRLLNVTPQIIYVSLNRGRRDRVSLGRHRSFLRLFFWHFLQQSGRFFLLFPYHFNSSFSPLMNIKSVTCRIHRLRTLTSPFLGFS